MRGYLEQIRKLLDQNREYYKCDFHVHSIHSTDGEDSFQHIIDRAVAHRFDIISITDHDDITSVIEYEKHEYDPKGLVIIPGVEFSLYSKEYGSFFHVLQYGISSIDPQIRKLVLHAKNAQIMRYKMQCELLKDNPVFTAVYTGDCAAIADEIAAFAPSYPPDYLDIAKYLLDLYSHKEMNIYHALDIYSESIRKDHDSTRQRINRANYDAIVQRLEKRPYRPERMLLKIIANTNSEEAFFPGSSPLGNISISDYGQPTIDLLPSRYLTVLAHPVYAQVQRLPCDTVRMFDAFERNYANKKLTGEQLLKLAKSSNVPITIGSDYHYDNQEYYNSNPYFYYVSYNELNSLYQILLRKEADHEESL